MTENLRHWSALGRTDPHHTKSFTRAGGFKGTATKPIWTEYRLTEHFGPCGIGWGCDEPTFTLVTAGEEILVFCTVRGWYSDADRIASVFGVGGDKVLVKRASGSFTDDEAYKKAFTDALGNAFKHIGSGADVHMGLFEDSKYVAEMRQEFAGDAPQEPERQEPKPKPRETAPPGYGNKAAPPNGTAEHPKRPEAIAAFKRIKVALNGAILPKIVDEIVSINGADLNLIKEVHAPSYEDLMSLSLARKSELLAAA